MKNEAYLWILLIVVIAAVALYFRYSYQPQISMVVAMNGTAAGAVSYPYQNARLPITVYNNGGSPIVNMSVGLFVNGNLTTLYKVTLPAGKQTVIPFNYTPSRQGRYNITALADPGKLYDISDRANSTSGVVLDVLAPAEAAPYSVLPSNGLLSREDVNLTRSGYAIDSYIYSRWNASEFSLVDDPEVSSFIGPVLNLTAAYINEVYETKASYGNGDRAYSIWLSSYISPSVVKMAAEGSGLNASMMQTGFGNMTLVRISNGTTFCSWYSGGWLKMLAYSGSITCYQALNESRSGAINASLLGTINPALDLNGTTRLGDYAWASGAANYEATLSLMYNYSIVYASISNNTAFENACYSGVATVNGVEYCWKPVIIGSGAVSGVDTLMTTVAYVGTHNLTAISLFNSTPSNSSSSYGQILGQRNTAIGIIKSFNVTGTPVSFLVNTCEFNSSFPCSGAEFSGGNLTLTLKNGLGTNVMLNGLSCYAVTPVISPNSLRIGRELAAGEEYNVTVPCYSLTNKISGLALNLNLGLQLNYTSANAIHVLTGKAYILGSA